MGPVEGRPPQAGAISGDVAPLRNHAGATVPAPEPGRPGSWTDPATAAPAASPGAETPPPSLASLLDQARAAGAELAGQPLPITNHHHRFIMNLFGG